MLSPLHTGCLSLGHGGHSGHENDGNDDNDQNIENFQNDENLDETRNIFVKNLMSDKTKGKIVYLSVRRDSYSLIILEADCGQEDKSKQIIIFSFLPHVLMHQSRLMSHPFMS